MNYYYTGELEILNGKTANETVRKVFAEHNIADLNRSGDALRFHQNYIELNDLCCGYLFSDLCAAVIDLKKRGYTIKGALTYYGDYDGTIVVHPTGTVEQLDETETILRNCEDAALIEELEHRGYEVKESPRT